MKSEKMLITIPLTLENMQQPIFKTSSLGGLRASVAGKNSKKSMRKMQILFKNFLNW